MMTTRSTLFFVAIALLGFGASGAWAAEKLKLKQADLQRNFVLKVPLEWRKGSDKNKLYPLVIVLHGGGGNGGSAEAVTGLTDIVVSDGAMVVYPDGSGKRPMFEKFRSWNAGHCCGYALQKNVDDVGFIESLIDFLVQERRADPRRVYVTGFSNGGMMAHKVGIELSPKIAAIAPVMAGLFGDEKKPATFVPTLIVNGIKDDVIPMAGGEGKINLPLAGDGTPFRPSKYQADFWAEVNGCEPKSNSFRTNAAGDVVWRHKCPVGKEVVHYLVKEGGHVWPGGKNLRRGAEDSPDSFNASAAIWDFFKKHSR